MSFITINGVALDLNKLEKDCWLRLLNGSLRSKDAFHTAALANACNDEVHLRTVVLRRVDTVAKTVYVHTDVRSKKWSNLHAHNKVSLLFYDAAASIQIRLGGTATLHTNDTVANSEWLKTPVNSRKTYLTAYAPSTTTALPISGIEAALDKNNLSIDETEIGRVNFGVIVVHIDFLDFLFLQRTGHKRAAYNYNATGAFDGSWLIP
jgi:pyridoxamine 5'-phosphate oxidase